MGLRLGLGIEVIGFGVTGLGWGVGDWGYRVGFGIGVRFGIIGLGL